MRSAWLRRVLLWNCFVTWVFAGIDDDFADNIFSDLAPLLTLFGERVTTQFLSQSTGWADNIILAVAPLGVITIIVGAIRVGGPSWLKANIGRARESRAVAEAELMSSTSNEVCELWKGQQIVRVMGQGPIREFLILMPKDKQEKEIDGKAALAQDGISVMALEDAVLTPSKTGETGGGSESRKQYYLEDYKPGVFRLACRRIRTSPTKNVLSETVTNGTEDDPEKGRRGSDSETNDDKDINQKTSKRPVVIVRNSRTTSPNLALNIHNKVSRRELYIVAAIGIVLQIGVLVYAGLTAYHLYPILDDGDPVESYTFPCTAAGTLFLVVGTLICAHVVERSTWETRLRPIEGMELRLVWLQKHGTVNDQAFDSFAIFPENAQPLVMSSHPAGEELLDNPDDKTRKTLSTSFISSRESITVAGTLISICGFVAQFTGLRGMHWSVSISQLCAVIVMTILRAAVRRHLARNPKTVPLVRHHELDWLAMTLGRLENAPWKHPPGDESWTEYNRPWAERRQDVGDSSPDADSAWDWSINTVEDPKERGQLSFPQPAPQSKFQEVLTIRRDLGEMAAWPGPAAGEAVALARAVEVVMNTLVGTAIKDEVVTWSLPAIDSSGIIRPDSVTFRIEKIDGRWRAFADELDAALSLWLYSVKDVIPTKPKGSAKGDEWLRTKETLDRASLRLLGQRTEALIRDLQWWAPEIASRVIDVEPADQETDGNTTPWELGNHRVVGFVSDTKGSYVRKIGHNLWEQHHVYKPRSSESPIERSLLAVESRLPLGVLYSQHMFTAFMWSTAKTMKAPIQGETDLQSVQQGSEGGDTAWQRFTLHDTQLSKIAREIQDTGLASLDDVYLSIIPPLSVANKLPDPSPIIDVVRARAMPFEESHRWENAAEVYLWLFRQTKSLSEDSYVRTKATALLAEYHKSLTFAVAMNAAFDPSSYETMSTSEVKNQVRKELLEGAVRDVLKDINGLYMLQGSPYGSGLSDSAEPGLVDYTTLLKLYTNRNHGLLQEDINRFSNPIQGECTRLRFTLSHLSARYHGKQSVFLHSITNVNEKDILDWTPLHYAALGIVADLPETLFRRGADLNAQDIRGQTALHIAVASGFPTAYHLLQCGADINARDIDGITPLHYAAVHEKYLVHALVERGADIHAVDAYGCTPLHWAVFSTNSRYCYDTLNYLIKEAGANLEAKIQTANDWTALHFAVAQGDRHIVKAFVDVGANKEAMDRHKRTPICIAAERGHRHIVALLIKMGANIEDPIGEQWSGPLHYAAKHGHESCLRVLIEAGANVNAGDERGTTPLHCAAEQTEGKDQERQEACSRILIEAGAKIEGQDDIGRTPLCSAIESRNLSLVKYLIDEAGAEIDLQSPRRTPLLAAIDILEKDIAKYLFEQLVQRDEIELHVTNNLSNHGTPTEPATQDGGGDDSNIHFTGEMLSQGGDPNSSTEHLQRPSPRGRYVCYLCLKPKAPRQRGFAQRADLVSHVQEDHSLWRDELSMYLELVDSLGSGTGGFEAINTETTESHQPPQ